MNRDSLFRVSFTNNNIFFILLSLFLEAKINRLCGYNSKKKIKPQELKKGAILLCGLVWDKVMHSAIYIGNGMVIERHAKEGIRKIPLKSFTEGKLRTNKVFVLTDENGNIIAEEAWADNAKRALKEKKEADKYNLVENNCHMFTAKCVTGTFDQRIITFLNLKNVVKKFFTTKNVAKVMYSEVMLAPQHNEVVESYEGVSNVRFSY